MSDETNYSDLPEDLNSDEPATKRDVGLIYRDLASLQDTVTDMNARLSKTATADDIAALESQVESAVDSLKTTGDKLQRHFDKAVDHLAEKVKEVIREEMRNSSTNHEARIAALESRAGLR